jgi:hypothetical protein
MQSGLQYSTFNEENDDVQYLVWARNFNFRAGFDRFIQKFDKRQKNQKRKGAET